MGILDLFGRRAGSSVNEGPKSSPHQELARLRGKLVSLLGFYADEAYRICERVHSATAPFPASWSHHESVVAGLWVHSLEVAVRCAERVTESRDRFMAFLVGLLHDTGKIAFYEVETAGYSYHPLVLPAKRVSLRVKGTRNNQRNHAEVSALLILPLLGEEVEMFSIDELLQMSEAVRLHHSSVVVDNPYLKVLRDADRDSVREYEERVTRQEEPTAGQQTETTGVETEGRVNLSLWVDCLRELVCTKFESGYHYYLLPHEDVMVLLLAYPKTFFEVNDLYRRKTGMLIHDTLFLQALAENGYVAARDGDRSVVKVVMVVQASRTERRLNFLALHADRVLPGEDVLRYATRGVTVKRFRGTIER